MYIAYSLLTFSCIDNQFNFKLITRSVLPYARKVFPASDYLHKFSTHSSKENIRNKKIFKAVVTKSPIYQYLNKHICHHWKQFILARLFVWNINFKFLVKFLFSAGHFQGFSVFSSDELPSPKNLRSGQVVPRLDSHPG